MENPRPRIHHRFRLADDDPSGIATYSQIGAQYGYALLWTALLQLPMLIFTQDAVARISSCTEKGLAQVIRETYGLWVAVSCVAILVPANTLNAGADIGAVAGSLHLLIPIPVAVLTIATSFVILALEILVGYRRYAKILRWLGCALCSYIIAGLLVTEPWGEILHATVIPTIQLNPTFMLLVVATFGTTITPFMFFWQGSQEVEEELAEDVHPGGARFDEFLHRSRLDTIVGMAFSELVQWFIIVVCATVLFSRGITNITSAAQAARALGPLAGDYAKLLFTVGIVGVGLMAIPVLIGASAYAVTELLRQPEGLSRRFADAHVFYGVIIVSTLIGVGVNFLGVDPVKILIYAAALNGLVAVPLLFVIARLNTRRDLLGEHTGTRTSRLVVWATFVIMGLAAVCLAISL